MTISSCHHDRKSPSHSLGSEGLLVGKRKARRKYENEIRTARSHTGYVKLARFGTISSPFIVLLTRDDGCWCAWTPPVFAWVADCKKSTNPSQGPLPNEKNLLEVPQIIPLADTGPDDRTVSPIKVNKAITGATTLIRIVPWAFKSGFRGGSACWTFSQDISAI